MKDTKNITNNDRKNPTIKDTKTIYDEMKSDVFIIEDGVDEIVKITQIARDDLIDIENNDIVEKAANEIISLHYEILNNIERGDIVQFEKNCYRNDFKLIWNGYSLINLEFDIDEYGHLPREFTIDEFPLNYWNTSISHNYIRWPTKNILKQIQNNFEKVEHPAYNHLWVSYFIVNGISKYTVIPSEEDENIDMINYHGEFWLESQDAYYGLENQVIFNSIRKNLYYV